MILYKKYTTEFFHNKKYSINSKEINSKSIFVAVKGRKTDGHSYIREAFRKGCKLAIVKKNYKIFNRIYKDRFIKVNSPLSFLENIASRKRNKSNNIFIGITGSFGKTTLKFMLSFILSQFNKTYSSPKSFNNHFGLPLSLANLPKKNFYNIFELGMSNKGEINKIAKILNPNIGIITNIGPVHLKNLKSLKNIALAKSEIIKNINKDGVVFLNIDNEYSNLLIKKAIKENLKVITFGRSYGAQYQLIKTITNNKKNYVFFKLKNKNFKFLVKNLNDSFIMNLLICVAVIDYLKLNFKKINNFIQKFPIPDGRGKVLYKKINNKKIKIIDESYNANPVSMKNAILNFSSYKSRNLKKIVILGDMLELGKMSKKYHKKLAEEINQSDIDIAHLVGQNVRETYLHLNSSKKGYLFNNIKNFKLNLKNIFNKKSVYLLKSSNSIGLNQFIKEC